MTSNNDTVSGKSFLFALLGIGVMLGFLAACGFGGYSYGVFVGRSEVLDAGKPKAVETQVEQTSKPIETKQPADSLQKNPLPSTKEASQIVPADQTMPIVPPTGATPSTPSTPSTSASSARSAGAAATPSAVIGPSTSTATTSSSATISSTEVVPSWSEVNEKFVNNHSFDVPGWLKTIGNRMFRAGDYAKAEACYMRSIAAEEATARRIYGEQKDATVKPADTTDDALRCYKSIKSLTEDTHPHSFYTLVIDVTGTMHHLAIIKDLRGNYADGDRLFKTVFIRHLFGYPDCPPFPASFGSDEDLQNVENGYKSLVATVEKKYGADSAYAATRLEQLAMCYDSMPQWVYSTSVKDKHLTQKEIREVMTHNHYSTERAQLVKDTFARAINIRQTVKEAADPDLVAYDQRRSKPSTYHNVH